MKEILFLMLITFSLSADLKQAFVECVKEQIGKPYVAKAEGPNAFDPSGLEKYCVEQIGAKWPKFFDGVVVYEPQIGDIIYSLTITGSDTLAERFGFVIGENPPIFVTAQAGEVFHIEPYRIQGIVLHQIRRHEFLPANPVE